MLTARAIVLIVAVVMFLIAARPPASAAVRFEWIGAAFVVLAWLL